MLRELAEATPTDARELRAWYERTREFEALLRSDSGALSDAIPHFVWHYLSDADIRVRDLAYRADQQATILEIIMALEAGRRPECILDSPHTEELPVKPLKIALIVVVVYVGIVTVFESMIGFMQRAGASTLVITTFDEGGTAHERVVSKLETDGHLYVAANHWPRAWYRRALANPDVEATIEGAKHSYRTVPVEGAEQDRVESENRHGLVFKVLTGFPPRRFLRLDPR